MGFVTYFFVLVFLPIAVVGYNMINRRGHFDASKWFLLFVSLVFALMATWQGTCVCVLLMLINYAIYKYGYKTNHKKLFMIFGVVLNIASLMFFKYLSVFMTHDIEGNITGGPQTISRLYNFANIIVPLGISFVTFSQISFLVDAYREETLINSIASDIEEVKANYHVTVMNDISLLDYSIYVLFFPKITMGPIALSKDFINQLNDNVRKKTDWDNIAKGLVSFAFGLAKKVLIADLLAGYVGYAYDYTPILGMTNAWIAVLAYTLQIYFDFSGFCDMASGIAMMMNFDLPLNFNSPYRSLSIGEFWDRWHITLTKFFTKYLYIPLGGSRKGTFRTYLNIMIVFFVSGIWHGSTINFVIWGLIHGVLSCISKALAPIENKIPKLIRWCVTFFCVNIAWVFFRAQTFGAAILMLKELFSFKLTAVDANFAVYAFPAELEIVPWLLNKFTAVKNTYVFSAVVNVIVVVFALFASTKMKNTNERIQNMKISKGLIAVTVFLIVWSVMSMSDVSNFIYVNF